MKYYLTTPIYYVNAAPHIGHTYTTLSPNHQAVQAHAGLRPVVLTTGTDEHGQKVERSAEAAGKIARGIRHQSSPNEFARSGTSSASRRSLHPHHRPAAYETVRWLFERCRANGYVYKGTYTGQYCISTNSTSTTPSPAIPAPIAAAPPKPSPKRITSSSSRPLRTSCSNSTKTIPISSSPNRAATKSSLRQRGPAGSLHHAAPLSNGASPCRSKASTFSTSGSTR